MRATPAGTPVCQLRLAVNDRVKDQSTGEWSDRANYFDVNVFGSQGERCGQYLSKGRQVAVQGRLRWSEWETPEGQKRQKVDVTADNVQFIGPREVGASGYAAPAPGFGATGGAPFGRGGEPPKSDYAESPDDDIPF